MKNGTKGSQVDTKSKRRDRLIVSWAYALAVFLLALLPRVCSLSAMITPDERRWVERSVAFFTALLQRDWASTFQEGHPGVTTMWTGTLGLWGKYLQDYADIPLLDYLSQVTTRPSVTLEYLSPARLPTAILTALCVLVVYLLLRRLFNTLPAILAAVLFSLDPFYLAHSRVIHHDALATTFSVIALVSFLGYVWRHQSALWLVLSGASAGLAFLSKGSALFLIGFMGMILLWAIWADIRRQPRVWRQVLAGRVGVGVVWFAIAVLVFVVFWPAMWVDPVGTFGNMLDKAVGYAQEAHSNGNYFMGEPVADPGPLFYPLVLLFRTTPLSLLGLLLFIVQLVLYAWRHGLSSLVDSSGVQVQVSMFLYVVIFTAFMAMGSKKFDRYLLSVFPLVDMLSGVSIAQAIRWFALPGNSPDGSDGTMFSARPSAMITSIVVIAVLFMQGLASLPQHPYYLSAYNALAGGPWGAMKTLLVGWGEGLEQAAYYLNGKEDPDNIAVSVFYYRDFFTFFEGRNQKLTDDNPDNPVPWQGSDYVVFYINQVQRQIPDARTVDYFQKQVPEFSFERNGIPYAQVYRTPAVVPDELLPVENKQRLSLDGKLEFLGYALEASPETENSLSLSLYWRALAGLDEDYEVSVVLTDSSGKEHGSSGGLLYAADMPTSGWSANRVMYTSFEISAGDEFGLAQQQYVISLRVSPGDHRITLE